MLHILSFLFFLSPTAYAEKAGAFTGLGLGPDRPYQCITGQATTLLGNAASSVLASSRDKDDYLGSLSHGSFQSDCPSTGDFDATYSCDDFGGDGNFNSDSYNDLFQDLEESKKGLQCRKAKLSMLNGELDCLNSTAQSTDTFLASVQAKFDQDLAQVQEQVDVIKKVQDDRAQQAKEIERRLMGDGTPGFPGLIAIEAEMRAAVDGAATELSNAEEAVKENERSEAILNEQVQSRTTALMVDCFNNTVMSDGDTCPDEKGNFVPVPPAQAVVCRAERAKWVSGDGTTIERDQKTKRQAKVFANNVKAYIAGLFGDAPKNSVIPDPKDGEKVVEFGDQSTVNLSEADFKKKIQSGSGKYQAHGMNIGGFLQARVGQCFARARERVKKEREKKSSKFGVLQEQIKSGYRKISAANAQLLRRRADLYTRMNRATTGQALPLDVNACLVAKIQDQLLCIKDADQNIANAFVGVGTNAEVSAPIPARDGKLVIPVNCNGVQGCITKLTAARKNVDDELRRIGDEKTAFVRKSNLMAENMIKEARERIAPQTAMVQEHISKINRVLSANLGISGINFPPIVPQGKSLMEDVDPETGLIRGTSDIRGLVAGLASPPMPDVTTKLASVSGAVAKEVKDTEKSIGKMSKAYVSVQGLEEKCVGKKTKKSADEISRLLAEFGEKNCAYIIEACKNPSTFKSLFGRWPEVAESLSNEKRTDLDEGDLYMPGMDGDAAVALATGMDYESLCGSETDRAAAKSDYDGAVADRDAITTKKSLVLSLARTVPESASSCDPLEVESIRGARTADDVKHVLGDGKKYCAKDKEALLAELNLDLKKAEDDVKEAGKKIGKDTGETRGSCSSITANLSKEANALASERREFQDRVPAAIGD